MIAVDHLIFEYPGLRALDDVSFRIDRGSITALTGPNGAGKTTLLRCMAALDQPVSGAIRIDGIDVLEQPRDCHRIIGYLSDFFGLYQRLTVRQCLHYVARAQGIDEQDCDAAIAGVCKRLHILERLEMRPGELSRGLRQRVAIAQAIIHQPQVVLLDEPASGLDPEARHELAELFLDLQRQGMTLLVSSHILAELEAYCSDMLVLRQGRIVEQVAIKNRNIASTPYKLSLATPIYNLKEILNQLTGISLLKIETDQRVWLTIDGDAMQQHRILKQLLALDLPVCEFALAPGNLQDAYLETIKQQP
ncbi:MAG: ABC transporter ATP-binding protein [Methylomicrobium sp.]|nr:ABC transporter ATP-binding protein [Methylomicrobium sp.]